VKKQIKEGDKFNRLVVLKKSETNKRYFLVKCVCGTIKYVRGDHLCTGKIQSCGCLRKETISKMSTTHGRSKDSIYRSWSAMMYRCHNKKDKRFYDYGGRGITVCLEWHSFPNFVKDMGEKPFNGAQIERINNNHGYSKQNCKWASRKENQRNMRSSRFLKYKGETKLLIEWAEQYNINYSTLRKRIDRNQWSVERAIEKHKNGQ
jgi:hypothetical protein